MQQSIIRRLDELERRARFADEQRRLNAAAAAANDQDLHWSERREWKEIVNLFQLSSIYNELPAYFTAAGRVALPTPIYPAHWGDPPPPYMTASHERNQALVADLNAFRDQGGVIVPLTLSQLATAREFARKGWYPFTQEQVHGFIGVVPHAEWGKFIQNAGVLRHALDAWRAQTGEHIDTPIALIEWLDSVWEA